MYLAMCSAMPKAPAAEVPRETRIACWKSRGLWARNTGVYKALYQGLMLSPGTAEPPSYKALISDGTWPGGPRVWDVPALSELLIALDGLR